MLNPQPGLSRATRRRPADDVPERHGNGSWAHVTGWEARTDRCQRVTCVVIASNQARELATMLPRLSDVLTEFGYPWELVVVDIESHDGTAELLRAWDTVPGVRSLRIDQALSRMHGLALALQQARGDVVVTCTPSDTRWSVAIPGLLLQWESGSKLVCPALPRDGSDIEVPDSGDIPLASALSRLALLDRQVVERLRITP